MGLPWGQAVGCSVFANSVRSQSILAESRGWLILMAAWQAMEAAMRRRRASEFSVCWLRSGTARHFFEHVFEFDAFEAYWGGLDGECAGAEGFGLEAVAFELFGDLGEGDHLRGKEVDEERHEEALALHLLGFALAEDFFEEDALVGDVLVDDPEALFVGGEDEGIAELAERLEGGEGGEGVGLFGRGGFGFGLACFVAYGDGVAGEGEPAGGLWDDRCGEIEGGGFYCGSVEGLGVGWVVRLGLGESGGGTGLKEGLAG